MAGVVDVVAAVLLRSDGTYMLAERPQGKAYAGYWEFPGGKVEPGESQLQAIRREIREELGIELVRATPWLTRRHVYEHASVRIRFFKVPEWRGEPRGLDGQKFAFQLPGAESVGPMLPANGPILKALRLPAMYGISQIAALGEEAFLVRLERALQEGLRLVQFREHTFCTSTRRRLAAAVLARCRAHGARLLISDDAALALDIGADGVHLPARRLRQLDQRPPIDMVGASVHDAAEIALAQALGCDFAILGPVLATPTHPGAATLGWHGLESLAARAEIPVFALGGMRPADRAKAQEHGAHGVAMIRGAWPG